MDKQRQAAIDRVEESRKTHVDYIEFYREFDTPDRSEEMAIRKDIAGDSAFHQHVITGYDNVLEVLRTPSPILRWLKRLLKGLGRR